MSANPDAEQLSRLRLQLSGSLDSFLSRTSLFTPRGGNRRGVVTATRQSGAVADVVNVLLSDERGMRALAKEIKRLITEDKRRGIGI